MDLINKLIGFLPFGKKEEVSEYFFALNVSNEQLTVAIWTIEGKHLKILETAYSLYSSLDDLLQITDKLLDQVIGIREIDVAKILFGVPSTWLSDENLKDEYLKLLRALVKDLELTPMAYVEIANALVHFLEKQEGIPPTAILVGFEQSHLTVTIVRAGKLDGVKVISRGDNSGTDIEKALLTFSAVETLPSKILIYGLEQKELEKLRGQLLSFSWMSKLSFLHFPKIDTLQDNVDIKSICLAGASEINPDIVYTEDKINKSVKKLSELAPEDELEIDDSAVKSESTGREEDLGFVVGDIASIKKEEEEVMPDDQSELVIPDETSLAETRDFDQEHIPSKRKFNFKLPFQIQSRFINMPLLIGMIGVLIFIFGAYILLSKAEVKIFVEPKILEKDTQVTADPSQKAVNEDVKVIPGQIIETEVSGSSKGEASGKKQIGDPAKGTVVIRNKTDGAISLSKGTAFASSNGLKFTLDLNVNVASRSADDGTWSKATGTVTAAVVGADGNLPSGSDMTVSGYSTDKLIAKSEGNFSGGTSKDVTVVSDADQQKLLASLASDLRKQAQQNLQEKYPGKKILEEALSENIVKKRYNKNINDQASEFSLNLTIHYRGTAFEDKDLKQIVGKLVTTQVPEGFELKIEDTETQSDVSKLEKDGKLIFLARFKAKLLPKIDADKIRKQIKGKSVKEVENILKGMDNILGSEIKFYPSLPSILRRLPLLGKNIKIEVGLK